MKGQPETSHVLLVRSFNIIRTRSAFRWTVHTTWTACLTIADAAAATPQPQKGDTSRRLLTFAHQPEIRKREKKKVVYIYILSLLKGRIKKANKSADSNGRYYQSLYFPLFILWLERAGRITDNCHSSYILNCWGRGEAFRRISFTDLYTK